VGAIVSLPTRLLRPLVLVYHGVGEASEGEDPSRLVVSPARFESQLRLLLGLGYEFVTAEALLDRSPDGRPARGTAVLTFDDGWREGLTVVAPLLERLGVRASFYVCPGMWGTQHSLVSGPAGALLTREEARALHERGMEVASHTLSHPDLRGLDDAALDAELRDSRAAVEELTGRRCRTFAYPFGLYDERVVGRVRAAGYELALAWEPRRGWDPFEAGRLPAPPRHGAERLAFKLLGVRVPERWRPH
jgi:peptidoglycan/xylan/chitin deacetylase (PgdA/CDA1 family)